MKNYYKQTWFKLFYIIMVMLFWLLLGVLLHWLLEWPILHFLTSDFKRYSLGISYQSWTALHSFFSITIVVTSLSVGLVLGFKWYNYIYLDKRSRFHVNK